MLRLSFKLFCFRFIIKTVLERLSLPYATVNIPINISQMAPYKLRQPPWVVW